MPRITLPKYLFVLPLLLLACAGPARADIGATFDAEKLSASYALSCDEQAVRRRANIPPPYFPGRPQEFRNEAEALVLYSPHLTAQQRRKAEQLFASLPGYVLPIAYRGGAVFVFARRSIVEAVPGLAVEDNWFQDFGLYMAVERRLYLPFEKGEGIRKGADGKYVAQRFVPSRREQFRIINHETGHLVDSLLGEYSANSAGEDGESRLSNRADFLAALRADLARLASGKGALTKAEIRKLGYYMPGDFEGVSLGGIQPTAQRARREVFAELWAEAHGYDSNKLSRAYPDTFKIVKNIRDFLKVQHQAAPAHCEFQR